MECPNCPGPRVPHRCLKTASLRDELQAFMKGKRVTGPVVGPAVGRSKGIGVPVRKERANAWAKLESSEELQADSTKSQPLRPQIDAHVLSATSKHKAQCTWKPTLRPIAKKDSELVGLHATPILPDHTAATAPLRTDTSPMRLGRSVSRIEDGDSCGSLDEPVSAKRSQCATVDSQKKELIGLLQPGTNCYIDSLLSWLNDNNPDQPESSISQDTRIELFSVIEANVSVVLCSESELPGLRESWNNDTLHVHCIAVWSVDEPTSGWKSDDWRTYLQEPGAVEYLMFCRIKVHRKERHQGGQGCDAELQQLQGDELVEGDFVVAYHLRSGGQEKQDPLKFHGQYFGILCPPNIFPLRATTIHRTSDQARWIADNRSVLPLPE